MPSKWMEAYMKRKYDDHRKRVSTSFHPSNTVINEWAIVDR
jgi:hypothetical protein